MNKDRLLKVLILFLIIISLIFLIKRKDKDILDVQIITESMDGEIFIDGKSIGKKVKDLDNNFIEKIEKNVKMKIVEDTPWGKMESEEVEIAKFGNTVELNIDIKSKELEDEIIEAINNYLKDNKKVKRQLDAEIYRNLTYEEKNKKEEEIFDLKNNNIYKEIEYKNLVYDIDSIKIRKEEDKYLAVIKLKYDYEEKIYYSKVETETRKYTEFLEVLLFYEDDLWNIYEIEKIDEYKIHNGKNVNI